MERGNGRGSRRGSGRGAARRTNQDAAPTAATRPGLQLQMLGPITLWRDDQAVTLPASRKLRALLAYLALSPRPVGRSPLCELLWDAPSDPRGELRWCLSRLRAAVDQPGRQRVVTEGDAIRLYLGDCAVDALDLGQAIRAGIEALTIERQKALVAQVHGDFCEGLELDDSPAFGAWLAAQRRQLRAGHAALLAQLATRLPPAEAFAYIEQWLHLSPFDRRAHDALLTALARDGRIREGEEHLATAGTQFEAEGLDSAPLRAAWRSARGAAPESAPRVELLDATAAVAPEAARRASIAVMPFTAPVGEPAVRGGVADALAHDIITRLSKLRVLFVIAQGSTFALHDRQVGADEAGRMLNVDYVLSGTVRQRGQRLTVDVELAETRSARIAWAETFDQELDEAFGLLDRIGNGIVASIAGEIETLERNRAILRPPSSLDAWEAHHRGLWHMYRFTQEDNQRARHFFETAVRLDPTFSRAYAGLSFTHFQDAFQSWVPREAARDRAFELAGQAVMVDDRDPAAHWAMGRAQWLRGHHAAAVTDLTRATDLSPNFALAHYSLAFVQAQAGDPTAAIEQAARSQALSPFDPLLFGFLGAQAMALARLGRHDEAAACAVRAAGRPNAHPHIHAIAAYCLALSGALEAARAQAAAVQKLRPGYGIADFLRTFQFAPEAAALFQKAAARLGMD